MKDIFQHLAPSGGFFEGGQFTDVLEFFAMVTKIWYSTSNNEIIVWSTAKGLDRQRVQQNIAYLVTFNTILTFNIAAYF